MAQEKTPVSLLELFHTIIRTSWPFLKVKLTDAMQQQDLPLGDSPYTLEISEVNLEHAQLELLDFMSTGTKAQNDVIVPKKAITKKNPFLNWSAQDIGRWVSTIGLNDAFDRYETLIQRSNISGSNLTTMTAKDLEAIEIPINDAMKIIFARDKILGFNEKTGPVIAHEPSDLTTKKIDLSNELDLNSLFDAIPEVANEEQFQRPMESWSISTVHEWISKITRSHLHPTPNENWQKCFNIIYEHMIDGKMFKNMNQNSLIQYGMDETYAIALIQTRDEFPKYMNTHFHDLLKQQDTKVSKAKDDTYKHRIEYDIGIFEFEIRLHGPLHLRLNLKSHEGFIPDCSVVVNNVDFAAKLQIQFDIVRNIIQIAFLDKPKIKTDIDVKLKLGLTIPLFGEDLWLPSLAETILERRDLTNPIVIRIDTAK